MTRDEKRAWAYRAKQQKAAEAAKQKRDDAARGLRMFLEQLRRQGSTPQVWAEEQAARMRQDNPTADALAVLRREMDEAKMREEQRRRYYNTPSGDYDGIVYTSPSWDPPLGALRPAKTAGYYYDRAETEQLRALQAQEAEARRRMEIEKADALRRFMQDMERRRQDEMRAATEGMVIDNWYQAAEGMVIDNWYQAAPTQIRFTPLPPKAKPVVPDAEKAPKRKIRIEAIQEA